MRTVTEENYLKAIYRLMEDHEGLVNTNAIAEKLELKPSTVTDMLKKMSQKGMVEYHPYKGALLTAEGKKAALLIIRKHRLWEVFLVEKLQFTWDEVHEVAEELEHITSSRLINKLDEFLGFPLVDPHGDVIPAANGAMNLPNQVALQAMQNGEKVKVSGVKNTDSQFLQHLDALSISLGSSFKVKSMADFDKSMEIVFESGAQVRISAEVVSNLLVQKI
jgi:DtxR family Mn-dependent transcriptional regulator